MHFSWRYSTRPWMITTCLWAALSSTKADLKRCSGMFGYYARWIKNYSAKVWPLLANTKLPMDFSGQFAFETLRNDLVNACLGSINDTEPFTVECDASKYAIGATQLKWSPSCFWVKNFVIIGMSLLYWRKKKQSLLPRLFENCPTQSWVLLDHWFSICGPQWFFSGPWSINQNESNMYNIYV